MIALMKFYTLGSLDKFLMKRVLSTPKGPIKLTKKVLIALLKDISSAIRDLHNFGIVHYDIKVSAILQNITNLHFSHQMCCSSWTTTRNCVA
jgi:serine/threonine protein kinase